jgi:hypothetical protein
VEGDIVVEEEVLTINDELGSESKLKIDIV